MATAIVVLMLSSVATVGTPIFGALVDAETNSSSVLDVSVTGGELTVDVRNAPLAQVLQAVGERAGVQMTLRGDLSIPVTDSFTGVPLEDGIRRLARGDSVTVTYAVSADAPGRGTLTGVWVIGRSSARDAPVAVRSTPEATSAPLTQGNRDSSEPGSTSLHTQERPPEPTIHFPPGGWVSGIQALADEADRGSETAVARLADISASEPSAMVREQAVAALGRLKRPETEPALSAALADDDVSVRVRAVRGLRETGTETAVRSLAGALMGDADPQVRLAALNALTSFPGAAMLRGLARAAADPDGRVREAAARGLAWWNTRLSGTP